MIYHDLILDGANPGANIGAAFTADQNETQLVPKGDYLDHFSMSIQGSVSTAAVTLESALGLVSQFTFKVGQETRIQLSASDLVALMAMFYKELPTAWENTDATGKTYVLGIKIPVQETIDNAQKYAYSITHAAVTNFASTTLSLDAVYMNKPSGRNPIIAVPSPYTTAGATGSTNPSIQVPPLGNILGILLYQTTVPTDAGITYDVQRVQMVLSGKLGSVMHAGNASNLFGASGYVNLNPFGEVLNNYQLFDFRDDPLDAKANNVQFNLDIETASEATRIIPIIEKV